MFGYLFINPYNARMIGHQFINPCIAVVFSGGGDVGRRRRVGARTNQITSKRSVSTLRIYFVSGIAYIIYMCSNSHSDTYIALVVNTDLVIVV